MEEIRKVVLTVNVVYCVVDQGRKETPAKTLLNADHASPVEYIDEMTFSRFGVITLTDKNPPPSPHSGTRGTSRNKRIWLSSEDEKYSHKSSIW